MFLTEFLSLFTNKLFPSQGKIKSKLPLLIPFVFLVFSWSVPSQARILTVRAPFKTMTLDYSRSKISLKGKWLNLNLRRKKCNGYILDRFSRQMNKLLKSKVLLRKKKEKESLEVQFERKKFFVPPRSQEAWVLLNLPIEVQRMKLETTFICRKKK